MLALFWFIISPIFTAPRGASSQPTATYLSGPEVVLDQLWALADLTMHSMRDSENFAEAPVR